MAVKLEVEVEATKNPNWWRLTQYDASGERAILRVDVHGSLLPAELKLDGLKTKVVIG
jgi:hypothetical protein